MLRVFDKSMQPVAILENAYNVGYEKYYNQLWSATFTLPLDDEKNEHCKPFYFVEIIDKYDEYIGLFRIMPNILRRDSNTHEIEYSLQHALSTLVSDVIEGYEQTTNLTTRENIEFILGFQTTTYWVLKDCEFSSRFHYKWESENGLLAPLFSIPQPFAEEYEWQFNTQVFPFELSLVKPSQELEWVIRYAHNLVGIEKEEDPTEIVNRIYPRGVGEGVNQLTVSDVNNGVTYLEDTESINKYGLQSYVWIDRRIENAETLKANGQSLLSQWKNPKVVYRTNAADVSSITGESIDKHRLGKKGRIYDPDLGTLDKRVMYEAKSDIFGGEGVIDLEIGSLTDDIATIQADIERKLQTNEAYSQGATSILAYNYDDNADGNHPAVIRFYVPPEAVNINKVDLTFETTEFRTYGGTTEAGGQVSKTTASGGSTTVSTTSASGGGQTTSSGGGQTSSENGSHFHRLFVGGENASATFTKRRYFAYLKDSDVATSVNFEADTGGDIYTYEAEGDHTHTVSSHTHSVSDHTHQVSVNIPAHSHGFEIDPHSHPIKHGIFTLSTVPSSVTIKVDGNTVPHTSTSGDGLDLVPYMDKDSEGKVLRGQYHTLEIEPNGLGRINAQVFMQLFLQSRGQYSI
ncbi:phage tail protein [Rossellomorea oryzaecorticis]|uniref:Phage tail protein n=1 Tax=Rossellomorea oryzaecorticis TaxID=1396505 RepID=A0ABU9KAD9_9BACI